MKAPHPVRTIILLLSLLLCQQAIAIRSMCTWKELLDSSDFIVLAEAVQVNEYIGADPTITFFVLRTFKGDPPHTLIFPCDKLSEYMRHFGSWDCNSRFVLFCKKEGNSYSLFKERFMQKEEHRKRVPRLPSVLMGQKDHPLPPITRLSYHLRELPPELEELVSREGKYSRYLNWDDLINWLENYYGD